jgi:virulence factor Mce-like protein
MSRARLPGLSWLVWKRLGVLAVAVAGAVAGALAFGGSGAQGDSTFRVDAVFDTAKGIIPGQLVKIAGARVGSIDDVSLTPDYKARISLNVDSRFAPFRTDSSCQIKPEGLTAENFVQCDPGSPNGQVLRGRGGHPPTVPVEHTAIPVNLTDLFNIGSVPVRERLRIVVDELGIGLAGRGEEVNAIIRRANPTLAEARRAIAILNRQRRDVTAAVDATDTIVAELASRRGQVQTFVDRAARVTQRTADRRSELADAIRRLPGLLAVAQPALQRLDELAVNGTPVINDLHASAPSFNRLTADLRPFARAAVPALKQLGVTATIGRKTLSDAQPLAAQLRRYAHNSKGTARNVAALFANLRDRGFVENLLSFVYFGAAATSRFDANSHILPAHLITSACSTFATAPVAGCSANFHTTTVGQATRPTQRQGAAPQSGQHAPGATAHGPASTAAPGSAQGPTKPGLPLVPDLVEKIQSITDEGDRNQVVKNVLDYLLKP